MIKIHVKEVKVDVAKAVAKRNMLIADKYMAERVKAYCDPYVPMQTGNLKNAFVGENYVRYNGPYAAFQYGGVVMVGVSSGSPWAKRGEKKRVTAKALSYHGGGKRGPKWDQRMLGDRRADLVADVANYIGGKAK